MELYIYPPTVVCNFEQSVIKALQTVLGPAIAIQGCFYHLTFYPPAVWNVHVATLTGEPCTNTQCEGWNNHFTHLVQYSHPTIWILIEAIQKGDCFVRTQISEDLIGNPFKKRVRRKQKNLQARLLTLCQDRQSGSKTATELLRGVGYNIRWKDSLRTLNQNRDIFHFNIIVNITRHYLTIFVNS